MLLVFYFSFSCRRLTYGVDALQMDRFQEPESHGLLCDLLWSDPIQAFGQEESNGVPAGSTFLHNSMRGCSFYYT